jgi:hypothetical protein
MIKLYLLYLPLGAYVLLRSFETWFCSHYDDCNDVITWLAMISSGMLFKKSIKLILSLLPTILLIAALFVNSNY